MVLGFTTWADGTCVTGNKRRDRQGIQGIQGRQTGDSGWADIGEREESICVSSEGG